MPAPHTLSEAHPEGPTRAQVKEAADAFGRTHDEVTSAGVRDLNRLSHADLKAILEAAICDVRNHYFERGQFDFDGEAASWCATLLLAARGDQADADPAVQP